MSNETRKYPTAISYMVLIAFFMLSFHPVIRQMVEIWYESEDYSYGFFIVPISIFLVYRKWGDIVRTPMEAGAFGTFWVTLSIVLYLLAHLAHISSLKSVALVMAIWSIIWALFGKQIFKKILFPMTLLWFMVPVPAQLYSMATIPLQLMVSQLSAFVATGFNVPVLREGNVLHIPDRTLAVVQACSGLRSLMSLLFLSAIFGYMTLKYNWLRSLLIISSFPVAIIVNAVRVISIILAFHYFDADLSKGTLHTVFGLLIFLIALAIIILIQRLFSRWDQKAQDE